MPGAENSAPSMARLGKKGGGSNSAAIALGRTPYAAISGWLIAWRPCRSTSPLPQLNIIDVKMDLIYLVPETGLEPASLKATDFKSVVYTDSTIRAKV